MKVLTGSLKRLATIGGAGLGLMLAGMTGAHAAAPQLAYHDFALHFTSNHNVMDARLTVGATTLNADGSVSFKGTYYAAPDWKAQSLSGTETPVSGGGYAITWMAGNAFNRTTFSGAVQQEGGATIFMTGMRYQHGIRITIPFGYTFYHFGPFPVCSTGYPIIP